MAAWLVQALVGLGIVVVSTGGAYFTARTTSRSSTKAAEHQVLGQIESSRATAEQGAYERAKAFYEGVITRQDTELEDAAKDTALAKREAHEAKLEVAALRRQMNVQSQQVAQCRNICRAMARRLGEPEPDLGD